MFMDCVHTRLETFRYFWYQSELTFGVIIVPHQSQPWLETFMNQILHKLQQLQDLDKVVFNDFLAPYYDCQILKDKQKLSQIIPLMYQG